MRIDLIDAYMSAYCIFSQKDQENRCLGEVFDERPDWLATHGHRIVTATPLVVAFCSASLAAGLVYFIR